MLEFLGITFLVVLGIAAGLVAWITYSVYQGSRDHLRVSAIEESLDGDPIRLEPVENPDWAHASLVAELARQIEATGAVQFGSFEAPAAGARLLAYSIHNPPAYIVVYDHDQVEPWIDVVLYLDGERTFTASTVAEFARGAPRPPEDEICYFAPGTAIGALLAEVSERASATPARDAAPDAFQRRFEEVAQRAQEFIRTQAVSQEWLDRVADEAGVTLSGNEAAEINSGRQAEQYSKIQLACIKALAESGNFTAAEWDELRDRLVAVWDDMPDDFVPGIIYDFVEISENIEDAVDDLESMRGTARDRIARFNARLPADRRLIRVGTVSTPVQADIYRSQLEPELY